MSPLTALTKFFTGSRSSKPSCRKAPSRRLGVESLEKRQVMAGNVTVAWANNALQIKGDSQDNQITMAEVKPGLIQVIGINNTRINGTANNANYFNKWSGNLNIAMGGGNDSVTIGWNGLPASRLNSIIVNMGAGSDTVEVKNTFVTGANFSSFNLGEEHQNDADNINVMQSSFRALAIGTGGGDDRVDVSTCNVTKAIISTGGGHDVAVLQRNAFAELAVSLGEGNDYFMTWNSKPSRSRWIHGGDGGDVLAAGGEGPMSLSMAMFDSEKFEGFHQL